MQRLKTILQSNKLYLFLIILSGLYVIFFTKVIHYESIYQDQEIILSGIVSSVSQKDDKVSFVINAKERIQATYYLKDNENVLIQEGSIIKLKGEINTPNNNTLFNTFNYQKYLYHQKIYKTLYVKDIISIYQNKNIFNIIKNKIYNRCLVNKYLSLFITGNKSLLEKEIYESYQQIGVAHLLAISGMHISMFIMILEFLLKCFPKMLKVVIIILFLLFYAFLVGFTPSVMRVLLCYLIKLFFQRNNIEINYLNRLRILCLSFVIQIIFNPFVLYSIGFQFSYLTSFSILITQKYHLKNYFLNLILITIFATLFTLPVLVNMNYEINLINILANLLLVPLISLVIYPFSLLTFICPFLLNIFIIMTKLMERISFLCSRVSFLIINIPKMNAVVIFSFYLLLLLFVYYGYKKFAFLLIGLILFNKVICYLDYNYQVVFFDVKQGDSSVIITPFKRDIILIDSGGIVSYNNQSNYYVTDNTIKYLKSIGITKISYFIITHGDFDHMGEAINLVNNFKVEKVIFNCGLCNDLEKELIKVLDKNKIEYYSCIKELNIDDNKLYFLQTKEYDNENDNSNVIYTELGDYKFMFMGDAGIEKEKDILDKYNISNIDVLKVGHHGSRTSSGKEFIDEVNPKYSIISVGKNNRYGHPNKEVLDNLENSKIFRTDQDGSIMLKIKNNKLKIETCSP